MNNKAIILNGLLGCLLWFTTGCSNDFVKSQPQLENYGTIKINITAKTDQTKATEPGEDVLNENFIEKIDLFFCQGTTIYWYVEDQYVTTTDIDQYTKRLNINVPPERRVMDGVSYTLYAVVNGPARSAMTGITSFSDLQTLVFESADFNMSLTDPLDKFLMTGSVNTGAIDVDDTYAITSNLELKRVASKIRIHLNPIDVEDFTLVGRPEIRLVNYADKTSLLPGAPVTVATGYEYKSTSYTPMVRILDNGSVLLGDESLPLGTTVQEYTTILPYYTYENDWTQFDIKETFIYVKVRLRSIASGTEVDYYYTVPLSTRLQTGSTQTQRNMLYDITADIRKVGNTEENIPTPVEGYVTVKPWPAISPIDGTVINAVYLVVMEKDIIMPNITTRDIEYVTNLPSVQIANITARFTGYNTQGQPVQGTPSTMPSITTIASGGKTYIRINNPVPVNYVPLYIEFDVVSDIITEHVNVVQYPPRYVTAFIGQRGQNYYQGDEDGPGSTHTNFNLFRITTIVNTTDMTLEPSSGTTQLECFIGDPATGANGTTGTDLATNRLISPDFIIASQNGVTQQRTYYTASPTWSNPNPPEGAQPRCINYWEQIYGPGRTKGGQWRLPTRAEIKYLDRLQDDNLSAVKNLLQGERYWSAQTYYYYNFNNNTWPSSSTASNSSNAAHIRCVYDMYKIQ